MIDYIPRTLEIALPQAVKDFPSVLLTGPRQSGKTTLLQHSFGTTHRFVSLDEPDVRALALNDPRLFMQQHPPPVVFDEIQYAPELLHYIKREIDQRRGEKGRYLLSGSQNLLLLQEITETLAGRAAVLTLLSMSQAEKERRASARPFWETGEEAFSPSSPAGRPSPEPPAAGEIIMTAILRGGYPELIAEPQRDHRPWFAAYLQTYLERDVRNIRQVGSLSQFQRFLLALAARTAQLLNISELARDIGISVNTAKAWLSVLEASYQIVLLRPYYKNLGKRLVKAPKLYFLDAALPAYLAGLVDAQHALFGPMGGALFENAVFGEIYRAFVHRGEPPRIFFWRTAAGHEVDFILDLGATLIPIETKLTATPTPRSAAGLQRFSSLFPGQVNSGYLICLTDHPLRLSREISALPFSQIFLSLQN